MAINKRIIRSNDEAAADASFNTVVWTGDGSTGRDIDVGFAPDLVWIKNIDDIYVHLLYDTIRGTLSKLSSNLNSFESDFASSLTSFNQNGFTVGSYPGVNNSGQDIVAWCWEAAGYANTFNVLENGSTTSSATAAGAGITAGSITTGWSVSANRDVGFSIVSYSGNTVIGSTIGHGLGVTPDFFIIKSRSNNYNWSVYHSSRGENFKLILNDTTAEIATGNYANTPPTSSVISLSGGTEVNRAGNNYIAYCFAEVPGFSKFGSYSGGTSAIDLGFAPSFIMIKRSDSASDWYMLDITRDGDNNLNTFLYANLSNAENTSGTTGVTVSGNTILPYGSLTTGGASYVYMAFANQF